MRNVFEKNIGMAQCPSPLCPSAIYVGLSRSSLLSQKFVEFCHLIDRKLNHQESDWFNPKYFVKIDESISN